MIHQYKNNGYNIVLDVNSGSVHVVDELVYDVVALLDEGRSEEEVCSSLQEKDSREDILEAISECRELEEAGVLFTEDTVSYTHLTLPTILLV